MSAQLGLRFPTHGGARDGAGRKPRLGRRNVAHRPRDPLRRGTPVHVTLRVLPDKAGLRRFRLHATIRRSIRASGQREHFRICHYSIQGNHFHLVCEATDRLALARGVQGFASSVARRLNRVRTQRGRVFSDRYRVRLLGTPSEVRNALAYCLNNWRRHREVAHGPVDPFSSADYFDGWRDREPRPPPWLEPDEPAPVMPARFWLLTTGWRRRGLIATTQVPGRRITA